MSTFLLREEKTEAAPGGRYCSHVHIGTYVPEAHTFKREKEQRSQAMHTWNACQSKPEGQTFFTKKDIPFGCLKLFCGQAPVHRVDAGRPINTTAQSRKARLGHHPHNNPPKPVFILGPHTPCAANHKGRSPLSTIEGDVDPAAAQLSRHAASVRQ